MSTHMFTFHLLAGHETVDETGVQNNWDICRLVYKEVLRKRWHLPSLRDLTTFSQTGCLPMKRSPKPQENIWRIWRATLLDRDLKPVDHVVCSFELYEPPVLLDLVFVKRWMDLRDEALLERITIRSRTDPSTDQERFLNFLMASIRGVAKNHHLRLNDEPEYGPARLMIDVYEQVTAYRSWHEPERGEDAQMLRQIFTTDATTIRAAIEEYRRGAGPKVVARLTPGAEVIEICDARSHGSNLEVQTRDTQWHRPFICYKEVDDGDC